MDEKSPLLAEKMRRLFHTNVAKLLYLTKRARPDILTATGFLCTRVTKATVQDYRKLRRVLGYLKRTQGWIIWRLILMLPLPRILMLNLIQALQYF